MTQSRNAVSNLVARYKAVLKNCRLLNIIAGAALAGAVVVGSAGMAMADDDSSSSGDSTSSDVVDATNYATASKDVDNIIRFTTDGELSDQGDATYTIVSTNSTDTGAYTIAEDNTVTMTVEKFTLHEKTSITGGGTLVVTGYLTQTASGSDISGIDAELEKSLIIGNDFTVGNVEIQDGAGIYLWIGEGDATEVDSKTLTIAADKTVSFDGASTISGMDDASLTINGAGAIAINGALTTSVDVTIDGVDTTIADGGSLTVSSGIFTTDTITSSGAITVDGGTLVLDSIALDAPESEYSTLTVSGDNSFLIVKDGLTVPAKTSGSYFDFEGGSVVVLGSGVNLTNLDASGVVNLLSNSNTNANFASNLITTTITLPDGEYSENTLTLNNEAEICFMGDGNDGEFITGANIDALVIAEGCDFDLGVGTPDDTESGESKAAYALIEDYVNSYNQGGTFAGSVTIAGSMDAGTGNWTFGSLTVEEGGEATVGGDSSVTTSSINNSGTFTVGSSASLTIDMSGYTDETETAAITGTITFETDSETSETSETGTFLISGAVYDATDTEGDGLVGTLLAEGAELSGLESGDYSSNILLAINYDSETTSFSAEKVSASEVIDGLDSTYDEHLGNYTEGSNSFLDTVMGTEFKGDRKKATTSAMQAGAAAGVGPAVGAVNVAGGKNIQMRVGSSSATAFNDKDTSKMLAMSGDGAILPMDKAQEGFGIWAMPMYSHTSADGFKSGDSSYGYDTDLYGVTLGADYTFASSLRLGLAFNIGAGESDSSGDFASTENDFDYVGIAAYGSMNFGKLALSADLGYISSDNEVSQANGGGAMDADVDASLTTLGIKAEYRMEGDALNVTPYAGARLNYYDIDSFNTKSGGANVTHTSSSDYTIVEFPIGVTFDTTLESNGWDITPSLGLGVKFAAGDLDPEQEASFSGVDGNVVFSSEVADAVTFQGALGLGMAKDAYSINLGYTLDLSENVESHGINLNLRYEF